MSGENAEIVRRGIDAWTRRDLPALTALYGPDAEVDWSRSRGPFKGVYRGRSGLEEFWNALWSMWEENRIEIDRIMETGSDVVVMNTAHFRGREGIEVSARTALVYTVENGLITCLRLFDEQDEALEAVGLRE